VRLADRHASDSSNSGPADRSVCGTACRADGGAPASSTSSRRSQRARLLEFRNGLVIAERAPLDFLAYLHAFEQLGRPTRSRDHFRRGVNLCIEAMKKVDLVVLVTLNSVDRIDVPEDEDPDLRSAMNKALLELADDEDLTGGAEVIEVAGAPDTAWPGSNLWCVPPDLNARAARRRSCFLGKCVIPAANDTARAPGSRPR
jgi:hypothetical protein